MSLNTVNPGLNNWNIKAQPNVSPAHGISPGSHHMAEVTLHDCIPYTPGGLAGISTAQLNRHRVSIKAPQAQTAVSPAEIEWSYGGVLTPCLRSGVLSRDHGNHRAELRLTSKCFTLPWGFGDFAFVPRHRPMAAKRNHHRVHP